MQRRLLVINQSQSINIPFISVIVPVFNGERYLAEALESIQNQTYPHFEIIVVNDGSSDGTQSVIKSFPSVKSISQSHSGLSAALNKGIKNSNGNFFAFLDADDIWVKDKLKNQVNIFRKNPDMEAVFGHIVQFRDPNSLERAEGKHSTYKMPGYCKGSMLIKRKAFLRIGFFDTQWKMGDFIEWYQRAKEKRLRATLISEVVMRRRVHSRNMSSNKNKEMKDYVRILKEAMDRKKRSLKRADEAK